MSSSANRPAAADVASRFDASAEARALLTPSLEPAAFVGVLLERDLWSDAAGFVGQWLGRPDAVTWACLAARTSLGEAAPAQERAALEAAERWLASRDEKDRRTAAEAAERAAYRSAPAMAAAAAGWTGGSLSAPDLPAVAPPEGLAGKGAAGAVLMAGAAAAPDAPARLRELIWLGVDIAEGRYRPGGRDRRTASSGARDGQEG